MRRWNEKKRFFLYLHAVLSMMFYYGDDDGDVINGKGFVFCCLYIRL